MLSNIRLKAHGHKKDRPYNHVMTRRNFVSTRQSSVLWPLLPHVKWIATRPLAVRDDDGNSIYLILLKNLLNLRMVENALRASKTSKIERTQSQKDRHHNHVIARSPFGRRGNPSVLWPTQVHGKWIATGCAFAMTVKLTRQSICALVTNVL